MRWESDSRIVIWAGCVTERETNTYHYSLIYFDFMHWLMLRASVRLLSPLLLIWLAVTHKQKVWTYVCFHVLLFAVFIYVFLHPPPLPHRLQSKQEGSVTEICSVTPPTPYCCLLLGVSPFVCVRPLFLMGHWDMCVSQYQLMDCRGQCTPALPLILLPLSFLSLMFPFTQGEQHIPENCESSLFHSKRLTLDKCTYVWNVIIYL